MIQRLPTIAIVPALLFAGLVFAGCRLGHRVATTATGAPRYNRINVVYDLNASFRDLPLEGGLQPVSYSTVSSPSVSCSTADQDTSLHRWKGARLSITYPHPDGSHEMAQATLRLSSHAARQSKPPRGEKQKPAWTHELQDPAEVFSTADDSHPATIRALHDEVWVLDFPKAELDLLVADLARAGFFESQVREDHGTHLDVQIDWGRTTKTWTPEPRLDEFVNRVHGHGRLSGFVAADTGHPSDAFPLASMGHPTSAPQPPSPSARKTGPRYRGTASAGPQYSDL